MRIPPDDMHAISFKDVLGKRPIVLKFPTPQLCQSRVCGPVTDIAVQLEPRFDKQVVFIHEEAYVTNDPNKACDRSCGPFISKVSRGHSRSTVKGGSRGGSKECSALTSSPARSSQRCNEGRGRRPSPVRARQQARSWFGRRIVLA
jgi:hypothetical protein